MKLTSRASARKPARTVKELILEAKLTKTKFLVVEGPSDRRFFLQWARNAMPDAQLDIVCVSDIEIDIGMMLGSGLTDGNRSMVIFLAQTLSSDVDLVRCLADRDCGLDVGQFATTALVWTDFPALESYAFSPSVLDSLNLTFLSQRIPDGATLLKLLGEVFMQLYVVRINNPHMSTPSIDKGLVGRGLDAVSFDLKKTVPPMIAAQIDSYSSVEYADIREVVYGHDLAGALMAAYGNVIKNQCGIKDPEALENSIRASILLEGSFAELPLFQSIQDWSTN